MYSVGELKAKTRLLEIRERPQGAGLNVERSPLGIEETQEIDSSGAIGIIHDVKVLPGTCPHVRQNVVHDGALVRVSFLRCVHIGCHGQFNLFQSVLLKP